MSAYTFERDRAVQPILSAAEGTARTVIGATSDYTLPASAHAQRAAAVARTLAIAVAQNPEQVYAELMGLAEAIERALEREPVDRRLT